MADRPSYPVTLPIVGEPYERPSASVLERFRAVSSATASAQLHRMGAGRSFVEGPRALWAGQQVAGSALTLQFMPKREGVETFGSEQQAGEQEHRERRTALWAVIEAARPGDVLVVQAYGDRRTGVMGEMLAQAFTNNGGLGVVVDGCVRDSPGIGQVGLPVWSVATTPNYASQSDLFPWAHSVPVAVGGALVLPGDVIVADDDGAVCVPQARAEEFLEAAEAKEAKETFSRARLAAGGPLSRYYPLDDAGLQEYERWKHSERERSPRADPDRAQTADRRPPATASGQRLPVASRSEPPQP